MYKFKSIRPRVIPVLLIENNRLVKTTKFNKPSYVGDPVNAVRIFNEKGVDELIIADIGCSELGSEPNYELVKELASECFMPLCYAGGVTTLDIASKLFSCGVEKVALCAAALVNPKLVEELAKEFGSQAVVVCLDVKSGFLGGARLTSRGKIKTSPITPSEFAINMAQRGAGELLVTSVDRDGTGTGYDLKLTREVASNVTIPVIANGGASTLAHFKEALAAGASAVAAGSMFVYYGKLRSVLITYPKENEIDQLLTQ